MQCICIPTDLHLHKPTIETNMNNQVNPALAKYANLMIEKMKEVETSDWRKPWFSQQFRGLPQNLSGRTYNNLNKAMLYFLCEKYNYQTPVFLTFTQAQKENVLIIKGQSSFPISYYELNIKNQITGERVTKEFYNSLNKIEQKKYKVIPFLRYFNVFNLDQTNFAEKYPEKWEIIKKQFCFNEAINDGYRNPLIDQTIEKQTWVCPIKLKEQDNAFYSPTTDSITLPTMKQFPNGKEFYYTALHEMAHSTGHPERLARKFGYHGTLLYAHEELIAELSSAVTGRDLGLAVLPRKENAQYLKGWLSEITNDSKYILNILQDVNKAVTMIEEGIGLNAEQNNSQEAIISPTPVMTEDEYLASKGYRDSFCSEQTLHKRIQTTACQQEKSLNFNIERSKKYLTERTAIKKEYQSLLDRGEIRQPTRVERIIKAANGHPELESTRAARRIALAEGISWQPTRKDLPIICKYYYDSKQQLHARFFQKGNIYDHLVWNDKGNYILCTGSRAEGNYVEHILPPEEIVEINKLNDNINQIELQSSGCKSLIGDISNSSDREQISNYRILDKSTGRVEPLNIENIDLKKQSSETLKKLLSGQQTEITSKSGTTQIMGLSKSPAGWTLQAGKQFFNMVDSSVEI